MMSKRAFMQARPLALENHQRKRALKHESLDWHEWHVNKEHENLADNIKQAML
jgi:hypothetical protein